MLIANSFYQSGEYEKAEEILRKVSISDSWVLEVKNLYALKNYPAAKAYAQSGLEKYSSYVENQDVNDVIDIYIKMSSSQTDAINYLLTKIQSKGKDYLLSLKCANSPENEKFSCYNNLYLAYPNEQFSADALANIFFGKIKLRDYANAQKIGKDHLEKFPDSASSPMVTFWMGKIAEYYEDYNSYTNYYKKTITRFPDTYYAYRAYLRLSRINNPIITSNINYKQVEYPYKKSKNNIIIKLAEFKDYDVLNELCEDEFIKSWIFYKKGDYSRSMLIARDAMEKINPKPDKYDLRWRLVYPLNYYDEIKNYSGITGNNFPLIMSLVREESYFDTLAQSSAGAVGLMQLMPSTAYEISSKYGLGINSYDALFNPAANLKAGNYYYSNLRSMLSGYDISAIAAYNGGIGSLQKWRNTINYNDTDEFVEQIPYLETRNYVRKVFRSYWNYIRIYSGNN